MVSVRVAVCIPVSTAGSLEKRSCGHPPIDHPRPLPRAAAGKAGQSFERLIPASE